MKITVIGSGAIGGVVGACLTRGGCDVMMLDVVPEHVKKMQEKRDNTLWMDPAVKFRVTGGALIVHTDTEISEIMAAMCG